MANSDKVCQYYGKDTCIFEHKEFDRGDMFYIAVRCYSECTYSIKVELEKEEMLNDGEPLQQHIEAEATRIFKFDVPEGANELTVTVIPTSAD